VKRLRWLVLSVVLGLVLVFTGSVKSDEPQLHPPMRPDRAILQKWIDRYRQAPAVRIDPRLAEAASATGSVDLLDHLQYIPSQRDQGSCTNGWAWAGTGVMEIALSVQMGIEDRLSEQFLNSCRRGPFACCGGRLSDLVDFYNPNNTSGKNDPIPWANSGAGWQDGERTCESGASSETCDLIDTSQKYVISSIGEVRIPTQDVISVQAIANIKSILDENKGVWFAFYLPTNADWNVFDSFWSDEDESAIWTPDVRGHVANSGDRGHAVLCVGYDDTDPDNRYWLMLNSQGVTSGRPRGLFRVSMDLPYDCQYVNKYGQTVYHFYWETLDVTFDTPGQAVANDSFERALVIPRVPYQYTQDTAGASTAETDPSISCAQPVERGGRTVWFRYTPTSSGHLNVNTYDSTYDTVLALWMISEGVLQPAACNDNSSGGLQSAIQVPVSEGATYYIEVVDRDLSRQTGQLSLTLWPELDWHSCLPLILKQD
jgi:hypothetical protein